jgi:hypothetical protein
VRCWQSRVVGDGYRHPWSEVWDETASARVPDWLRRHWFGLTCVLETAVIG